MKLSTSFQQSNHLIWSIIKFKLVQTYGTRVLDKMQISQGKKTVDCTLFSWRMVDFVHQQIKKSIPNRTKMLCFERSIHP
jgi:hypothetical protein